MARQSVHARTAIQHRCSDPFCSWGEVWGERITFVPPYDAKDHIHVERLKVAAQKGEE